MGRRPLATPFWWGLWFFSTLSKKPQTPRYNAVHDVSWGYPKNTKQKGAWGCAPSTGFTCVLCCLRTAKNARCCVPQLYRGVWCFFGEVEKTPDPTRIGNVREPGSLTHPQVTPMTLMVNTISCPALCVFAPLREALPGLYHQSPPIEGGGNTFQISLASRKRCGDYVRRRISAACSRNDDTLFERYCGGGARRSRSPPPQNPCGGTPQTVLVAFAKSYVV
jgi:hypothetical protein